MSARPLARHLLALLLLAPLAPGALAADPPKVLRELTLGARTRAAQPFVLGAHTLEGYRRGGPAPHLLWWSGPEPAPVPRDREAVRRWLDAAGGALGHGPFTPVFEEQGDWLGRTVWSYRLTRAGVELVDARVRVYWEGERLLGLLNDVPTPLGAIAPLPDAPDPDAVYLMRREGDGAFALDLARRRTERAPDGRRTTTFRGPSGPLGPTVVVVPPPSGGGVGPDKLGFDEWPMPPGLGGFPDQIDTDPSGRVWFSQPLDERLTLFDPATEIFTPYAVTQGSGPDGMIVDGGGLVWTGLIFNGGLGVLDPLTGVQQALGAPFAGAKLAIPTETSQGTIVVTDHSGHVVEWDPVTQQWIKNLTTPTANPHIVAGVEDDAQVMWFTEFNVDKLARLDLVSGALTEVAMPGTGGPAFPAWSGGKVWFSLWNLARLACYDPGTGQFTFFDYGPAGEVGGPIFTAPNGDVCMGTRGDGRILVHRAATGVIDLFEIPTSFPGLKDGLTVAADGAVWFTESGVNRIGRLRYP